jgi:hypothetical protein
MQFTEPEAKAFWPLYKQYRADMDKSGDALLRLIKEYAQLYPDVPDDRAKVMLKDLGDLQKQRVETRTSYLKKIEKALLPAKTLRFAQVETRLDLALQIELASEIPLVPIEGRLAGRAAGAAVVAEGVPGESRCKRINDHDRNPLIGQPVVTLWAGTDQTDVGVGPEAMLRSNPCGGSAQTHRGRELAAYVAGEGETPTDSDTTLVALAPALPGGTMVATTKVTAGSPLLTPGTQSHPQFEDGTTGRLPSAGRGSAAEGGRRW